MKDRYRDLLPISPAAGRKEAGFDPSRKFLWPDNDSPLFITELWT